MKIIKVDPLTIYFLFILVITGFLVNGIIIFIIVIIHELGHIIMIKHYGYQINSINIYPFGGITKIDKDLNTSTNKELLIASGGIIVQLLLQIIIYIFPVRLYIKTIFINYNLSILIFNLLPIIPLDGSIIVNSILNKYLPFKRSYLINIIISIIGIVLYITFNYWYSLNNYLIIGLFIYKIYEYIKNYPLIWNRFLLERYLHNYKYNRINTKKGDLNILKIDTYQYFIKNNRVISEKNLLRQIYDRQ